MDYLYLTIATVCMSFSGVVGSLFNRKNEQKKGASTFYNLCLVVFATIFWAILFLVDFSFDGNVIIYSVAFGFFYLLTQIGMIRALKEGPVVLSSLMLQLSLIGVTLWGFFFWGTKITVFAIIGLSLVVLALFFCFYTGKETEKISFKWLLFIVLAFLGNMGCSIVQRYQQTYFNGQYGNELMLFAMFFAVLLSLVLYLKSDKADSRGMLKTSAVFPALAAAGNVALNVFVMLLATSTLSPTLIYPVIAVGGLALTTIFSVLVFKEKLKWWQWLGIGVGAIAIVFLNLG
jgi:drug/metabolite transporter (DMT)-like permease